MPAMTEVFGLFNGIMLIFSGVFKLFGLVFKLGAGLHQKNELAPVAILSVAAFIAIPLWNADEISMKALAVVVGGVAIGFALHLIFKQYNKDNPDKPVKFYWTWRLLPPKETPPMHSPVASGVVFGKQGKVYISKPETSLRQNHFCSVLSKNRLKLALYGLPCSSKCKNTFAFCETSWS